VLATAATPRTTSQSTVPATTGSRSVRGGAVLVREVTRPE
jgi:hypothetical protein